MNIVFALKALRNNLSFVTLFVTSLAIGVFVFMLLFSVKRSVEAGMQNNLRVLLGADIAVTARQPINQANTQKLNRLMADMQAHATQWSFMSMVGGVHTPRLLRVAAIDQYFPLYGSFTLARAGVADAQTIAARLENNNGVWMEASTMELLGVALGDTIKIGEKQFLVDGDLLQSPASFSGFSNFVPTIYIGLQQLKATNLVNFGSRVRYMRFFVLPEASDVGVRVQQLRAELGDQFDIVSYENANNRTFNLLQSALGYLGLIALIALFLSGVGAMYAFRWYLRSQAYSYAIWQILGAQRRMLWQQTVCQLFVLITAATALGTLCLTLLLPVASIWLSNVFPLLDGIYVSWSTVFACWVFTCLCGCAFCVPTLILQAPVKPIILLREAVYVSDSRFFWYQRTILSIAPILFCFWMLSWFLTSWQASTVFVSGFTGTLLLLAGCYCLFAYAIKRIQSNSFVWMIALRTIVRNKFDSAICFIVLAICGFLITLVPVIGYALQQEITTPKETPLPRFFLFDIQPEQVATLKQFVHDKGAQLQRFSPMVQAELTAVNGAVFAQHLEDLEAEGTVFRGRRTHFNVSYRDRLGDDESLLAGEFVTTPYDHTNNAPAAVSIAKNFADRYNLTVGDNLRFDVQGIEINTRVSGIRRVVWRNLQPNFFILMQPGVLEAAPKTYLATIANVSAVSRFIVALNDRFSNISLVDVSATIDQVLGLATSLERIIVGVGYLMLLAAVAVIFCIIRIEIERCRWEISLLRVLGTTVQDNRMIYLCVLMATSISALLAGQGCSLFVSYLLTKQLLLIDWAIDWLAVFAITVSLLLSVAGAWYIATKRIIALKPWYLLRSSI